MRIEIAAYRFVKDIDLGRLAISLFVTLLTFSSARAFDNIFSLQGDNSRLSDFQYNLFKSSIPIDIKGDIYALKLDRIYIVHTKNAKYCSQNNCLTYIFDYHKNIFKLLGSVYSTGDGGFPHAIVRISDNSRRFYLSTSYNINICVDIIYSKEVYMLSRICN